jgi:hypothetical protein
MSGLVGDLWGAEIEHRRGCFSPTALDRVPGFPEAGTIAWANGVDLALVPLYEEARHTASRAASSAG